MTTPIALFTFNRVDLLKKTINSLKRNNLAIDTDLFVFSDGPKGKIFLDEIKSVRKYLKKIKGFKSCKVIEREINLGLEKNILSGLEYIFENFSKVIVMEDDIITSKFFLKFMNDALNLYENDLNVSQINGYSFLESYKDTYKLDDLYFIKGADCLAWGTWKNRWINYNDDAQFLVREILRKKLERDFNRDNNYNFLKMLKAKSKKGNSWAICWYASNFLLDKYALYPLKSLACHIGNDSRATNYISSKNDSLSVKLARREISLSKIEVSENSSTSLAYNKFLMDSKGNFLERLKCFIKVFIRHYFIFN